MIGGGYYILKGHEPVLVHSVEEWAKAYDSDDRFVAKTEILGARISTVFLGLDHQFGEGPPLIFETMVFPSDSFADTLCERCSTWDDAEAQHRRAVEWARGQYLWRIKNIVRSALKLMASFLLPRKNRADTAN